MMSKAQVFVQKSVKFLIFSALWGIFVWLSYKAIDKYIYEPISTEIVYTTGDDGINIKFPIMTICPYEFARKSLDHCSNGSEFYQEILKNCLENDPDFDLNESLRALHYDRQDYFEDIKPLRLPKTTQNDQESLWSPVIHARFGLCYSIDLDKSKHFSSKLKDYERDIPVYTLELKDKMTWTWMTLMLHEKDDLPDAFDIHPRMAIEMKTKYWIRIKKKIIKGIHTQHSKCSQFSYKTCLEVFHQKRIESKYGCDATFLFNASHLQISNLTQCPKLVTLEILKEMLQSQENVSDCQIRQACHQTKYTINVEKNKSNTTFLGILYEDPVVEHHNAYRSYDGQSLLGEIGGTLGLTLGLSLSSINDYIDLFFQKLFE